MVLLSVTCALNVKMDPESVSPFNPMLDFIILFWELLELVLVPPQPTKLLLSLIFLSLCVCLSAKHIYPTPSPLFDSF